MALQLDLGAKVNGMHPKSKAALRRALNEYPGRVLFYSTSAFDSNDGSSWFANKLPEGTHYIVGPDPYNDRRFYGTVTVKDGTITVK